MLKDGSFEKNIQVKETVKDDPDPVLEDVKPIAKAKGGFFDFFDNKKE